MSRPRCSITVEEWSPTSTCIPYNEATYDWMRNKRTHGNVIIPKASVVTNPIH